MNTQHNVLLLRWPQDSKAALIQVFIINEEAVVTMIPVVLKGLKNP